jgi:alkylation response protein AidB-like acyl-CoA dehydrogenase
MNSDGIKSSLPSRYSLRWPSVDLQLGSETMCLREPSALSWLEPHLAVWAGRDEGTLLKRFETDLRQCIRAVNGLLAGAALLRVKKALAYLGYGGLDQSVEIGGLGEPSATQMLVQFVCGYHDLDLRDAAHIGHGRIVLTRGSQPALTRWAPELIAGGALCGIAMTEEHGGTSIRRPRTTLHRLPDGRWTLTGEKCWVSRIHEASCFVVLARVKHSDDLATVLIDQARPGLVRTALTPFGLQGWSWGRLRFEDVMVEEQDFLGPIGDGLQVVRGHFRYYRPIVAVTCLGAAAAVADTVRQELLSRRFEGMIKDHRDTTLELLGRAQTSLHALLALALTTARLVEQGHPQANQLASGIKAHAIDAAYDLSCQLALLSGARHMQADSPVAKRLRDLRAYLCADGIHDELLRSSGREYLQGGLFEQAYEATAQEAAPELPDMVVVDGLLMGAERDEPARPSEHLHR